MYGEVFWVESVELQVPRGANFMMKSKKSGNAKEDERPGTRLLVTGAVLRRISPCSYVNS